ncbi:uncharacterized protein STEHIDRAFT_152754 [Stereum hirsutum FP-91666 SS1]|uniref:uncharacterized protein n=1 Tax=Stereum hirsutum (strain FP-91666) TaxID=721885 RepID=UPI000440AC85|nr:uncharacterized protein STEHIDRAFT_152754 [Stereum hirsutum FP-91666 SS1]EIM91079.1 hypothetical protein STEHIDRAFT_152754 [Stereum hirsutum FP-91666 SS1]
MSAPVPSEPTAAQKRDALSAATENPQGSSDDTDTFSLDIPALDFIRTVWGFDSAKLHLDKWTFKLLPELLLRYKILHKNPEARQAFFAGLCAQAMMDYISAMKKLWLEDEIQRVSSGYVLDESGSKAPYILDERRKPFTTELSRLIFPRLQEVIAAANLPSTRKATAKQADMPVLWNSVLAYFVYEDIDPLSGSSTLPTSPVMFARITTSEPIPIPRRGPPPPPEAPSSNKKHRAAADEDSDEDDLGIPPRQKDERSGEDAEEEEEEEDVDYDRLTSSEYRARQHKRYTPEMLAEHYASQAFESEARLWTSGVMINEFTISLWYHDRMGTLRAQPFDFVKEPECLLGLVVGLASAKYENFGFDPMFVRLGKPAEAEGKAKGKGKGKEKATQDDEMDVDSGSEEKPEFTEADAEVATDLVQFLLKMKKFNVDPTGGHLNMGPNSVCLGRVLEEDSDGEDDGDEYESLLSFLAKEVGQEDMVDKIASLVKG